VPPDTPPPLASAAAHRSSEFIRRLAVITAGIRFHHNRVDRETFALDKAIHHAPCNDTPEDVAQNVALAEAI